MTPQHHGKPTMCVSRHYGCDGVYLPAFTMRKLPETYPVNSKTDKHDAYIVTDSARSRPHTLRPVARGVEPPPASSHLRG
ncbi:transposase [Corynebacterium sp. CCM 8864]|uniref:Transposase n=1 Tax=Corynebacterium marambiense TaxID=2765364 RepID=A0ABS0VWU1_9CORY|nr:transposase [Corynebacterium marambiense]